MAFRKIALFGYNIRRAVVYHNSKREKLAYRVRFLRKVAITTVYLDTPEEISHIITWETNAKPDYFCDTKEDAIDTAYFYAGI